ncbi:MAG: hypothetical protein AAFV33_06225 [Chloroflexota bacterium]
MSSVDSSIRERACLHCGNRDYTWANVTYFRSEDKEGNVQLREKNPDPPPREIVGAIWSAFLREPLVARKCNICGNVQLFTPEE